MFVLPGLRDGRRSWLSRLTSSLLELPLAGESNGDDAVPELHEVPHARTCYGKRRATKKSFAFLDMLSTPDRTVPALDLPGISLKTHANVDLHFGKMRA